nr:diguanylate cyclase [Rhodoferax sp.]
GQVRAAESRLREVIDAVPAGVAIYDNQDRLLGFNREVARQYPYCGEGPVIGETYETLMRRALDAGQIPDAIGREEEWLALRLAGRGALRPPLQRHIDHGPWVHLYETRTPSGYLVMTRMDLTPLVEKGLALERANEQQLRLSTTDGLIGIANRRMFDQTLQNEWQRCARNQSSLSLLMVDIDHFKHYNDHYGHLAGDECLRQVARILGLCVKRSGELVARYGGEEFALLLPGTDLQEGKRVAQRCLHEMLNARIPHEHSPVSPWLTCSIGVATIVAAPGLSPATLVGDALAALAHAKVSGRARVEMADPSPVSAPASLPAPL